MNAEPDDTPTRLEAHGRALRELARAILGSSDGADDVVQEAYARALLQRPTVRNRDGWLVRVVQNLARRRLRDRARHRRLEADLAGERTAPSPDELLGDLEVHRRLTDAVAALREPLRSAVVLRFLHDLPPRTIAQQLGVPVATVKSHLQRGLAELRAHFDRREPDQRRWLLALVPFAEPRRWARLGAGAPPLTVLCTGLWIMAGKHLAAAAAALLCASLLTWAAWPPPHGADGDRPAADVARSAATDTTDTDAASDTRVDVARESGAAADDDATPQRVVCGQVVADGGGAPLPNATVRLVRIRDDSPPFATDVDADGRFELRVPGNGPLLPYDLALAGAPGLATRQVPLDAMLVRTAVDGRIDLGTLRLERGIAVVGRVLDAEGMPLAEPTRLLLWDPVHGGSSMPTLLSGRTVGFSEPGGHFALTERLSPAPGGSWMLAAIGSRGLGFAAIEAASGQQTLDPIDLRLIPGGSVQVRVVDAGGAPVADAEVRALPYFLPVGLAPMWEPKCGWSGIPRLPEMRALLQRGTDAHGQARFTNLPRRVGAAIDDANRQHRRVPAAIVSATAPGFVPNGVTIDPPADGCAEVEIVLQRQRRVALHGHVLLTNGAPVAGVGVRLNGYDVATTADDHGAYRLPATTFASDTAYVIVEGGPIPRTFAQVPLAEAGDELEHDFVVEARSPVTVRVVDRFGQPVAGAELLLGIENSVHYPGTPERTGADGRLAFPDAVPSHDHLWIRAPEPSTAWQPEPARRLTRRDDETIVLQRIDAPLVRLDIVVLAGGTGAPVSPTFAELLPMRGSEPDYDVPQARLELAHGHVRAADMRPGDYLLVVRGPDELRARQRLTVAAGTEVAQQAVELWPAASLTCRVDWSGIGADAAAQLGTVLVLLDAPQEESYATDERGERLPLTPNTGSFRAGERETCVLQRVTPRTPLRLRMLGDAVTGETWFEAAPSAVNEVVLRPLPAASVAFTAPAWWSPGRVEIEARDETGTWRPAAGFDHSDPATPMPLRCGAGTLRWRAQLLPANGGAVQHSAGETAVRAGAVVPVLL